MNRDTGVKDLYDSERKALRKIAYALRLKHSFHGVTTLEQEGTIKRAFEMEARNRCAEIGLLCSIQWDPEVSDDPTDQTLYWNPRLIIDGRIEKLSEFDHDRQKHEVRKGTLDGVEGVVNPNTGLLGEPKKKDIY